MSHARPLRRRAALALSALAFVPTLSACGFGYATDRVYTPAAGFNSRDSSVAVLGAVVVTSRPGEGTLVARIANRFGDKTIGLQGVNPAAGENVTVGQFPQINLKPLASEDLSTDAIPVTGDYGAGDVLSLSFVFSDGETTTMDVAVVTNCDEFAGYDTAFADASSTPSPSTSGADETDAPTANGLGASASPSSEASGVAAPSSSPSSTSTAQPYDCAFPAVPSVTLAPSESPSE